MLVVEKIPNGKLVTLDVQFSNNLVSSMKITGDFFLHPEELINELEKAFVGVPVTITDVDLSFKLNTILKNAVLVGVTTDDLIRMFRKAVAG